MVLSRQEKTNRPRKNKILFYARPTSAQRNLFEIGLKALANAIEAKVLSAESWEIFFIGEKISDYQVGSMIITNLPWMDFPTYCKTLRQTDIALSLMLSPHPSYTPLEAAACGCLAITNIYTGKSRQSLESISPNILAAEPTVESVTAALFQAVKLSADTEARERGSHLVLPKTWDDSFAAVIPSMYKSIQAAAGFGDLR